MKITHRDRIPDHITDEELEQIKENMISMFRYFYPEMSDQLANYLKSKCKPVFYPANEVIVDYQEVCDHLLFMSSGLISSSFFIDDQEKKPWFHTPGKIVIAVDSWYTQSASEEKLTAMQDSLCMAISWEDYENILSTHIEFNIPVRLLTEYFLRITLKRTLLIHYDALSKYKFSIKNHWDIVKSVPHYDLAAMLGVARETLSRLKNRKW